MEKDSSERERIPGTSSSSTNSKNLVFASVPRYKVDLDLPVDERWNQIVDDYKGMFLLLRLILMAVSDTS